MECKYKEVIEMKFTALKKMMAAGLVAVMAAVAFTGCGGDGEKAAQKQFLNIGTGVVISHSDNIDSLNLPIAASIALYAATRKDFGKGN